MEKGMLGGYDCNFVSPPTSAFQTECPICCLILRDPHQSTCCGTSFCRSCFERVPEHDPCPVCRELNFEVFTNKGLKRALNQLQVSCTHVKDGCEWKGELGDLDQHLSEVHSEFPALHAPSLRSGFESEKKGMSAESEACSKSEKKGMSVESEAFRRCSGDLMTRIQNPDLLAWQLYSKGVLSEIVVDKLSTMELTTVQKITKLLSAVRDEIAGDQSKFESLVIVLREQPELKDVAVKLAGLTAGPCENDNTSQPSSNECVIDNDIIIHREALGSGAFGSVYKGKVSEQPCAVKVLNPLAVQILSHVFGATVQSEALTRFQQECKILEQFKHPNVVRHLSTRIEPRSKLPVLVMELMDESLTHFLEDKRNSSNPLSFYTEVCISFDIASALKFLHSNDIIHRDLCSDNVLLLLNLEETPIAKISDFGMSRILDPDSSRKLTTLGHREAHLPPEARKIASKHYDTSLDIFSFGVVLVQIVTKSSHISREDERDKLITQIEENHPLCSFIHNCVQCDKNMRPDASDICCDLETKVNCLKTS